MSHRAAKNRTASRLSEEFFCEDIWLFCGDVWLFCEDMYLF